MRAIGGYVDVASAVSWVRFFRLIATDFLFFDPAAGLAFLRTRFLVWGNARRQPQTPPPAPAPALRCRHPTQQFAEQQQQVLEPAPAPSKEARPTQKNTETLAATGARTSTSA